jgi:hypothetical protein
MNCHCCGNKCKTKGANHCSLKCRSSCSEYQANRRKKYREKTGFDHQSQNPLVKEKKKQTFQKKYGVNSAWQLLDNKGKNNPFFGKKHSLSSLLKMRNPDREDQAIRYKTKKLCHSLLWMVLRTKGIQKKQKTYEMLGYTPDQFRKHIESLFVAGMSWENHGRGPGKWNIDHIRPINTFPNGTTVAVINELSNLRPLWFEENMRRPKDGSDMQAALAGKKPK